MIKQYVIWMVFVGVCFGTLQGHKPHDEEGDKYIKKVRAGLICFCVPLTISLLGGVSILLGAYLSDVKSTPKKYYFAAGMALLGGGAGVAVVNGGQTRETQTDRALNFCSSVLAGTAIPIVLAFWPHIK